jgi:hypothetical protein
MRSFLSCFKNADSDGDDEIDVRLVRESGLEFTVSVPKDCTVLTLKGRIERQLKVGRKNQCLFLHHSPDQLNNAASLSDLKFNAKKPLKLEVVGESTGSPQKRPEPLKPAGAGITFVDEDQFRGMYAIGDQIGYGATSTVYKAVSKRRGRAGEPEEVAIKLILKVVEWATILC